MKPIRVLLADDHVIVRSGLRLLLDRLPDIEVIGEAADGREAVQRTAELSPNVVVLDIAMANLNGIEAARQITAANGDIAVVMLSMHADETYVLRALKVGARGYVLKDAPEGELIACIRAVHARKAYFSPAVSKLLVEDYVRQMQQRNLEDSYELLTGREREILQLLAEGKSNKEIAQLLNLSPYTVETHRGNVLQKLNLHSVPELILYAVRKGIIN